ncbi:MAG: adenylyl-sulfate kinase [Fibromonadaceae bacterium]|jgi:adenylylsulfate kinase|nr:adenylyl-sulfate kinase [Fibromonadaceae bacterium]
MVCWLTGLSGAGKTTIGRELYKQWKKNEPALVLLDGDELREVFGGAYGYTREDRKKISMQYSKLCKMLAEQGINVILCGIILLEEIRQWNYANIPNYKEIFISVPMDILKQRDKKGLYGGKADNVMGVDIAADFPAKPDLEILNDGSKTAEEIAGYIMQQLVESK